MSRVIADGLSKKATATTQEAEDAVEGKYPDAAGVHAAFNQYGLGAVGSLNAFQGFAANQGTGNYLVTDTTAVTGLPDNLAAGSCVVTVLRNNHYLVAKNETGDNGRIWHGVSAYSTTAPTTWKEIFHTGNILGTVSQSAGVPTGAIIESGSNGNGEYVKFADGTLICTQTRLIDLSDIETNNFTDKWTAAGNDFPVNFVSPPSGFLSMHQTTYNTVANRICSQCQVNTNNDISVLYIIDTTGITNKATSRSFKVTTVGRWF